MGKKIMNTVLFLVVLGGCVAMTLLTGNGSSGTMIYNFAFLAVMAGPDCLAVCFGQTALERLLQEERRSFPVYSKYPEKPKAKIFPA